MMIVLVSEMNRAVSAPKMAIIAGITNSIQNGHSILVLKMSNSTNFRT